MNNTYIKEIIETLKEVGISANLNGYEYLKSALSMVLDDRTYLKNITSRMYTEIAKEHNTRAFRVERGIRHAIEVAFQRMDPEQMNRLFGRCTSYYKGKVTNAEFIAILAEKLRLELGLYN